MKKSIKAIINKSGKVTFQDLCGFGMSCEDVTREVEAKMGKVDENSRQHTAEYYKTVEDHVTVEATVTA